MIKFDVHVQRQIIALGLDDFTPNAMLLNMQGRQYGLAAGYISAFPRIDLVRTFYFELFY